jgi:peptidoglycan/LPS O-acetylase OafA/YrhL
MILLFIDAADVANSMKQLLLSNIGLGNLGAYILSGDYFSPHGNGFLHLWSLSTELQFYLIAPVLLFLLGKLVKNSRSRLIYAPAILTILSLVCFIFSGLVSELLTKVYISDVNNLLWYYSPGTRMWEFFFGFIIWQVNQHLNRPVSILFRFIAFAFLLFIVFSNQVFDTKIEILATVLSTSLILVGKSFKMRGPIFGGVRKLGDISYSVYLVHFPIVYLFQNSPHNSKSTNLLTEMVVVFVGSIAFGYLSYYLVELRLNLFPRVNSVPVRLISIGLLLQLAPVFFVALFLISFTAFKSFAGLPQGDIGPTWIWDTKCENYQDPRSTKPLVCDYGDRKGVPKVLLIGDSHAAVISKEFVNLALQRGLYPSVSTFEGCPYFSKGSYDETPLLFKNSACRDHNRMIQEWVEREKPFAIFYSFRGSIAYSPNDSSLTDLNFNKIVLREISQLSRAVTKVSVFIPIPEWEPHSLLDSMAGRDRVVDERSKQDRKFWSEVILPKRISFSDPYPSICPESICNLTENGKFKYRDANHLSDYGVTLISALISKQLQSVQNELPKVQNR